MKRCAAMNMFLDETQSKEGLLKQVDGLRDVARRTRRLAEGLAAEGDRTRLSRHGEEMEEIAARLEKEAADAKTSVMKRSAA